MCLQRGFAIPANPSGSSEGNSGLRQEERDEKGPGKFSHGELQQQVPSGPSKRLIILAEIPSSVSTEEVKRAVNENLAAFNQGQCVDVRKPPAGRTFGVILEVDSLQSAHHLVESGLSLNGRQVCLSHCPPSAILRILTLNGSVVQKEPLLKVSQVSAVLRLHLCTNSVRLI